MGVRLSPDFRHRSRFELPGVAPSSLGIGSSGFDGICRQSGSPPCSRANQSVRLS